ncbi:hypothetical protein [Pseudomonas kitaguniensis]|uniref:hypothetical protein n=1 Tax=Pseudomonas kitaguniensis TaxID=2607908 RepID=UPI003D023319
MACPDSKSDVYRRRKFDRVSPAITLVMAFWVMSKMARHGGGYRSVGRAPRARRIDWAGSRNSHDNHHVEPISEGGEVNTVDKCRVNTPKKHVDAHKIFAKK